MTTTKLKQTAVVIGFFGIMTMAAIYLYFRWIGPELSDPQVGILQGATLGFLVVFGVMSAWGGTFDKN